MLTGIATTSSSEDKFGRVKVSCPFLWEVESTLLPVLNSIFVSKGDEVVLFSPENLQQSLFVLGVIRTKAMMDADPIDTASRPVLFKAHVGKAFIIATLDETLLHLETDGGLKLDLSADSVKLDIPASYSNSAKSVSIEATGGSFSIKSKDGKDLFTVLSKFLTDLPLASPATLGSPSAQNFSPATKAVCDALKTNIDGFI